MSSKKKLDDQKNLNKEIQKEISLEDQLIQILAKRKGIESDILSDQQDINNVIQDQVKQMKFQASEKKTIRDLTNQITKLSQEAFSISSEELGLTETNVKIKGIQEQLNKKIFLLVQQQNKLAKDGGPLNQAIADSIAMQVAEAQQLKNNLEGVAENSEEISSSLGVKSFGALADVFKAIPGLKKFSGPFEAAAEGARGMAANIQEAALSGGKGLTKEKIKQMGLEKQLGKLSGAAAAQKIKGMSSLSKGSLIMQAGFKSIGPILTKALGPVAIIMELVKAFKALDAGSGEMAKNFGISAKEGTALMDRSRQAAQASGDILVSMNDVKNAQIELNKIMGTGVEFSGEFAAEFASVKERTGLSEQAMAKFASKAQIAGTSIKEQLVKVSAVTLELNAQNGISLSLKEIQEGIGKISNANALSAKNNTKEMANQVFQAKMLGLEQGKVNDIADGLLDFQSSIEAEMHAELITNKQLNLEKARTFALNNDMAGVASELAKQGITAAEFGKMNRMEQQAIAASMSMSRDEMGDMLMNQEKLSSIQSRYGDDVKSMSEVQAKYQQALEDGTLTEEMKAQLAEDGVLAQMESATAQDKLNAAMEKMQDLFVGLITPLMPLIDAIMALLDPVFKILTPIFNLIGEIVKLIVEFLDPSIQALVNMFEGIAQFWEGLFNLDFSMMLDGLKTVGMGIIDFLLAPFDGLIKLLNKIPGVDIPKPSTYIKDLVGLEEGGIVTKPTTALIGEGGEPEAVIPLSKLDQVTGGGGKASTSLLKQLNNNVIRLINVVEAGGDVYMDGNKVGKSLALATSNMG
mgnify:FL=1|tara:strand:+ start:1438 stop:3855 length:2418 start_codon:yes stop_codon:yes gene_type:complete